MEKALILLIILLSFQFASPSEDLIIVKADERFVMENCEFRGRLVIYGYAEIENCTIYSTIECRGDSSPLFMNNRVHSIKIYDSSSPSIVNNRFIFRDRFECIDGAVDCFDSASPLIKGNEFSGHFCSINCWRNNTKAEISGNFFHHNFVCIHPGMDSRITDNRFENSVFGIVLYNDLLPHDNDLVISNNDFSRTPLIFIGCSTILEHLGQVSIVVYGIK